jgi:hypothetical protein
VVAAIEHWMALTSSSSERIVRITGTRSACCGVCWTTSSPRWAFTTTSARAVRGSIASFTLALLASSRSRSCSSEAGVGLNSGNSAIAQSAVAAFGTDTRSTFSTVS